MDYAEARHAVHVAAGEMCGEGEIAIGWVLTIEVVGQNGRRYLAHRAGGGVDGSDGPTIWNAMGMHQAAADDARDQLRASTRDANGE